MQNEMPQGGVKELMKSSDGRRYLARLQARHADDIQQPYDRKTGKVNPRFFQLYGKDIKKRQDTQHMQVVQSRDMRAENRERRTFKKKFYAI